MSVRDAPQLSTMASGNLSLLITEDVSWDSFPDKAQEFIHRFKGRVLWRGENAVDQMWIVLIKGRPFFLTLDDFPWRMSLDSMISFCNSVVRDLHLELSGSDHE